MPVGTHVGRERELQAIAHLLDGAPEHGGALIVRGDAGIGKSSLLETARGMAARTRAGREARKPSR